MPEAKLKPNAECSSAKHSQHLCHLMYDGFHYSHPAEYKKIVQNAEFRCQDCARTAELAEHLCAPIKL